MKLRKPDSSGAALQLGHLCPSGRWPILVFLTLVAVLPLPAQEAEETTEPKPFARTRLEPGPRVTVGQPVTLVVEVLAPSWFTAAPWFPTLDVADAIALFDNRGVNFTERIADRTWAGQSRSYQIYPQRPGSFEIDAIPVRVRYNSEITGPRTRATVSPPPVIFEAVVPEGARGLPYFISTPELSIEPSFDRSPEALKVGEAFTRTITVTVRDALSMVMPPLPSEPIPGLAAYPEPPEVRDAGGERGAPIVGTRVERTTFVAEGPGDYRLPPIELAWWDVGTEQMRTTVLPAVEIHVEPDPDRVAEIPLPAEDTAEDPVEAERKRVSLFDLLQRWGGPLFAAALTLMLSWRLWRRYAPFWSRKLADARRRRRESETTYFRSFRGAALTGDPKETWNRLTAWLDRTHIGPGAATIHAFVTSAGDPELEREASALDALLFGADRFPVEGWSGRAFYRCVARARRQTRSQTRGEPGLAATLNPGRNRPTRRVF